MRLQIKVNPSARKEETVEMRVIPSAVVVDVKNSLCEHFKLLSANHVLCKKTYIDIPFIKTGKLSPNGRFEETGNAVGISYGELDDSKTFAEQFEPSKLERSYNNELMLKWKVEAILRCPICGLQRSSFTRNVHDYMFGHSYSELLVCSNCNNADRVVVGIYHEPINQSSEKIVWQSNTIIISKKDAKINIYELYGKPRESYLTGDKIRLHRSYEFSNPKFEELSNCNISEIIKEILLNLKRSNRHSFRTIFHKLILVLKILGITLSRSVTSLK